MRKLRRTRSVYLGIFCLSLLASTLCFAQGMKMAPGKEPLEEDHDQPLKRELWFRHGRTVNDRPAATLLNRAVQQKKQMKARLAAEQAFGRLQPQVPGSAGWTSLGPSPLNSNAFGPGGQDYGLATGRVTAVTVDPNDATGNTVYIGGAYGGVWKSTNATDSPANVVWTPITDDQPTLSTGAIAVQPGNPNVVLVGTGEPNAAGDSYYGLGILRSTDGGNSWTLINQDTNGFTLAGLGFSKIAFSADNPNLVTAAGGNFALYSNNLTPFPGPYWSSDAGATWTLGAVKDSGQQTDHQQVWDVVYNAANHTFYAAIAFHGFYSSTDGKTWNRLAVQPGGSVLNTTACPTTAAITCPIFRGELAVRPGANEMYAWWVSIDFNNGDTTDRGIYKSTDGGASWAQLSPTGMTNCGDTFGCGAEQGFYNLDLAAVPNGNGTDVFAGAINLFKCSINATNPLCGVNPFLNLTHVYGCFNIANVHPDEHGISYAIVSNKAIMFFGNDGGVNRALNGYDLIKGGCGTGTNPFDNLNATLGSLTQFMSFSQHPTDQATLLGGTQDNGSPATNTGGTGATWISANGGDGGFNEINPTNPVDWFTSNPFVNIYRCQQGINCDGNDFQSRQIVSSSTLGNDQSGFYMPFLLDPGLPSKLIAGTCRVWRGNTDGTGFTARSNNFDTFTGSACTGGEGNLITAMAAGGPVNAGHGSEVIYAGTAAGHVFRTVIASGGPSTWIEVTNSINPRGYQISGVAIDPSDPSGQTAYVTIMGFGISHVWKTTNAGANWINYDPSPGTSLPDAPADAVVVDPENSLVIYVATDVGVYTTSNGGASWSEVGPASGPGQLPNVTAVALRIFNSGGQKLLRVGTHGRGIWQTFIGFPDYSFSPQTSVVRLFPNQDGGFSGNLTGINGYNNTVTISCDAGSGTLPPTCNGGDVTPAPPTYVVPFSVSTGGTSVADYQFNIKGTGNDSGNTSHSVPVTLHIVDFGFSPPDPASATVNSGSVSTPVNVLLTGLGFFNGTVTLSCPGLPAGVSCNFYPSPIANPVNGSPVTATITVSTPLTLGAGQLNINLEANSPGLPTPKMQTLPLTVTTNPDFNITPAAGAIIGLPGGAASLSLTLSPVHAYQSTVNVSCTSSLPNATCTAQPNAVSLASGPGATVVNIALPKSTPVGNFPLTVTFSDTTGTPSHQLLFNLQVIDFSLTPTINKATISAGQTAKYTFNVAGVGGTFDQPVSFSCSGLPAQSTCSFSPSSATPGSAGATVTMSVITTARFVALRRSSPLFFAMWLLPMAGMVLVFGRVGVARPMRKRALLLVIPVITLVMMVGLVSCGGGGGSITNTAPPPNGTIAGNYQITVVGTSGPDAHSTSVTLVVQ